MSARERHSRGVRSAAHGGFGPARVGTGPAPRRHPRPESRGSGRGCRARVVGGVTAPVRRAAPAVGSTARTIRWLHAATHPGRQGRNTTGCDRGDRSQQRFNRRLLWNRSANCEGLVKVSGGRQGQGERRTPVASRAGSGEDAAVRAGDLGADREADPGATGVACPGRVGAVEALEDVGQVFGLDAVPGVGDGEDAAVRPDGSRPGSTRPPAAVCRSAFDSRFASTWPTRWASARTVPVGSPSISRLTPLPAYASAAAARAFSSRSATSQGIGMHGTARPRRRRCRAGRRPAASAGRSAR